MRLYVLLKYLPSDIINYIFYIEKREIYGSKIYNFYKNYRIKHDAMKNMIDIFHINYMSEFENSDNFGIYMRDNLKIIKNSIFAREKYNKYFWESFLAILSRLLNNYYTLLLMNHKNSKYNYDYICLKESIRIWFYLSCKHNIKLALLFKKKSIINNYIYVKARNIKEIKNFERLANAPIVLDNGDYFIDIDIAKNYFIQFY